MKQVTIRLGCHAKVSSSKPVKPIQPSLPSYWGWFCNRDESMRWLGIFILKNLMCQGSEIFFTLILAMTWQLVLCLFKSVILHEMFRNYLKYLQLHCSISYKLQFMIRKMYIFVIYYYSCNLLAFLLQLQLERLFMVWSYGFWQFETN